MTGDCLLDRLSVIEDSRLGDLLLVVLVEAPRAEAVSPVARAVDGAAPFGAAREHVYLLAGSGRDPAERLDEEQDDLKLLGILDLLE